MSQPFEKIKPKSNNVHKIVFFFASVSAMVARSRKIKRPNLAISSFKTGRTLDDKKAIFQNTGTK